MEDLMKLEELQRTMSFLQSQGIIESNSLDQHSHRFLANLVIFLMQPCGELDLQKKCALVSDHIPKISDAFLEKASLCLSHKAKFQICEGFQHGTSEENSQLNYVDKRISDPLQTNIEEMAVIGLDAMQRANSTLEDFCRSYFMFHGMDANKPQVLFKYLPLLSFMESYIYQLDRLNEKIVNVANDGLKSREEGSKETNPRSIAKAVDVFKDDPFRSLAGVLDSHGLLSHRIKEEFKHGQEYWALERRLCYALANGSEISVEDVMKAIHLKSFDYRVLNLLLYQLREEQVDELHMEFLSVSELLVELADDLFDYEDDVLENSFNVLRMFVRIYGTSAPAMLAKYITEAEEKYNVLLKNLDPKLSSDYQRRCEEATREGGNLSKHPLGTWSVPPLILDEELYRSRLLDPK